MNQAERRSSIPRNHVAEGESAFATLRCPQCKGLLILDAGLHCRACSVTYPIVDGIPVMLPEESGASAEQDRAVEKGFYEAMFSGLRGLEDGHCIVYGHERIYDFVSALPRGTIFEPGCGAGHHSVSLSRRGFAMTSMDLSLNGLNAATKLAEREKQNIFFLSGDMKKLPFADNQFDICFCSLVLHHFMSLDNLIKELSRVTRKYFVAFEVNALDPISFLRFNVLNPTFGITNISSNQRALFPRKLMRLLEQNGFRNFVLQYDDMHEYLGKSPQSVKARLIRGYQQVMRIFPKKYSRNKFLLRGEK